MNTLDKLLEEFERVICVREHIRHDFRNNKARSNKVIDQYQKNVVICNEAIALCRDAIMTDDASKYYEALEETKRIP